MRILAIPLLIAAAIVGPAHAETDAGAELYSSLCLGCHKERGQGALPWYPSLKEIVRSSTPEELAMMIDTGQFRRAGELDGASSHTIPVMPSWAWLSDEDLAGLVNYLTRTHAESYTKLSPEEVAALRLPSATKALSAEERRAAQHLYLEHCVACHGTQRQGITAPPLSRWPLQEQPMEHIRSMLHYGAPAGMPGWGVAETLSAHQMTILARYLKEAPLDTLPPFDLQAMRDSWSEPQSNHKQSSAKAKAFVTLLHDTGRALVIDPKKKQVAAEFDVGFAAYSVLTDTFLYTVSRGGWVSQFDLQRKKIVGRVRAGYEAVALALTRAEANSGEQAMLAVTTIAPPGISFFNATTLEPMRRLDSSEPLGPVLDPLNLTAVLERTTGCVYSVSGSELADECEAGVPYPRYAQPIQGTRFAFLVGELGTLAVFDTEAGVTVANVQLPRFTTPGKGAIYTHSEWGQVFAVSSMTSDKIYVIGADPENHPDKAWHVLKEATGIAAGSLYVSSHPKAKYIAIDSALSSDPEIAGTLLLLDKNSFEPVSLPVAEWADLNGGPRVIQPQFNAKGDELWITIWNRQDFSAAIVVINPRTLKLKHVIRDRRLITPIRSYFVNQR